MSCDVSLPISDIVKEVKNLLNLDSYVKSQDGEATNLILKGGVTLDAQTVDDLCDALSGCLGNAIKAVTLTGEILTITTGGGDMFPVDLSKFVTDVEVKNLADGIKAAITDDYLVSSSLDNDLLTLVMKSGRTHTVSLASMDSDVSIRSMSIVGNELVVVQTDGTTKRVDLAKFVNTPVAIGNRALANDGKTVLGYWVNN